jgi:hypothetical protein
MRLRRSATHASLPDVFRALGPAPTLAELARASKAVRRNPELSALLSEAAEGARHGIASTRLPRQANRAASWRSTYRRRSFPDQRRFDAKSRSSHEPPSRGARLWW